MYLLLRGRATTSFLSEKKNNPTKSMYVRVKDGKGRGVGGGAGRGASNQMKENFLTKY